MSNTSNLQYMGCKEAIDNIMNKYDMTPKNIIKEIFNIVNEEYSFVGIEEIEDIDYNFISYYFEKMNYTEENLLVLIKLAQEIENIISRMNYTLHE